MKEFQFNSLDENHRNLWIPNNTYKCIHLSVYEFYQTEYKTFMLSSDIFLLKIFIYFWNLLLKLLIIIVGS